VFNNLGLALAGQGRFPQAYSAFLQGGSEASACNNMGYVFFSRGDYRQAVDYFEKAIAASPTFYVKAGENLQRAKTRLSD
jgi:Flp pilus assembly protein TadD